MRLICEDQRSMQYLRTWSAHLPLELVKFYFWNAGVVDQRSQTGLFRSLLYEILSKHRDLIQSAFPAEWDKVYNELSSEYNREGRYIQLWSLSKLRKAFAELINQARSRFRICFFLDGLDEYDGDHAELATFFRDLSSQNNHLKLCISSRPWPVFDDIFEHAPGLKLQDLTRPDIKLYVEDHLAKNKWMLQLQEEEPTNTSDIIEEIVQRACGVFLWVKLVVKSLMNGLTNRDDVSRLRERLEALQTDLEMLYGYMLDSIDNIYRRDASAMFQMVRFCLTCPMKHRPFGIPDLYQALTVNFKSTMDTEIKHSDESMKEVLKRYKQYERLETSLKASCKGLLEVPSTAARNAATIPFPPITYLHRTVIDYLDRPEVLQKLLAQTTGAEPSPQVALLMATIVELKERRSEDPYNWGLAMHALDILERLDNVQIALAEELDRVMSHHYSCALHCLDAISLGLPDHTSLHWSKSRELHDRRMRQEASGHGMDFLHFAVENNLACYVDAKVALNSCLLAEEQEPPLLFLASSTWNIEPSPGKYIPKSHSLKILVDRGANPNQSYKGLTIWQYILHFLHSEHRGLSAMPKHLRQKHTGTYERWQRTIKHLLQCGADPHVCCLSNNPAWTPMNGYYHDDLCQVTYSSNGGVDHSLKTLIRDVFGKKFPEGAIELLQLLEEKKTTYKEKNQSWSKPKNKKRRRLR